MLHRRSVDTVHWRRIVRATMSRTGSDFESDSDTDTSASVDARGDITEAGYGLSCDLIYFQVLFWDVRLRSYPVLG